MKRRHTLHRADVSAMNKAAAIKINQGPQAIDLKLPPSGSVTVTWRSLWTRVGKPSKLIGSIVSVPPGTVGGRCGEEEDSIERRRTTRSKSRTACLDERPRGGNQA